MKILFSTQHFAPRVGGAEIYVAELASHLTNQFGAECTFVTAESTRPKGPERRTEQGKTYYLPSTLRVRSSSIGLGWGKRIENILSSTRPDVVVGNTPVPPLSDIVSRVASKHSVPFVITVHGVVSAPGFAGFLYKGYRGIFERWTYSHSSGFVATSQRTLSRVCNLIPPGRPARVIPPGVDIQRFQPASRGRHGKRGTDPLRLLFVSQLHKESERGFSGVIDMFAQLAQDRDDLVLRVVGGGDQLAKLREQAHRMHIENRVEFRGEVPYTEIHREYQESDLLMFPSTRTGEGFGMTLIEAGSCGLPVVTFDVGGAREAVLDGETGYVVPRSDGPRFVDRVEELIDDAEKRERMGAKASLRIGRQFTWSQAASSMFGLLSELSRSDRR